MVSGVWNSSPTWPVSLQEERDGATGNHREVTSVKNQQEVHHLQAKERILRENTGGTLILVPEQPPELWENKCQLSKPCAQCVAFFMEVLAK